MTTTNSLGSGCEVESATFHAPVDRGLRGKLDTLKTRGMNKMASVKSNMNGQMTKAQSKMQTSMKTSPMKWAGIAAGSGFALGLLGRFVHWRNYHRRMTPDLVIIESNC